MSDEGSTSATSSLHVAVAKERMWRAAIADAARHAADALRGVQHPHAQQLVGDLDALSMRLAAEGASGLFE